MALVAAVYLTLALRHRAPVVYADESGYLGNARWLTGGPRWWMDSAAFYGLGYPLLLVPIFILVEDPELLYRSVLLLNVVLCALLASLLYLVSRYVAVATHRAALLAATVGVAYPAIAVHVGIAWVEIVASVGVALLILTASYALARPSVTSFAAHAVVIVYLVGVHGRFTLLSPIAASALRWCDPSSPRSARGGRARTGGPRRRLVGDWPSPRRSVRGALGIPDRTGSQSRSMTCWRPGPSTCCGPPLDSFGTSSRRPPASSCSA